MGGKASRRQFIAGGSALAGAALAGFPAVAAPTDMLTLSFLTIPDPDGWHPQLRLKGDWLVFKISDGALSGYGEASHSKQDDLCKSSAEVLFQRHYSDFKLTLDNLRSKEAELAALDPDFVTATALSGLNQALYDLLAKREGTPVWRLFRSEPGFESLPLYTTINRALKTRSGQEYFEVVSKLARQGFQTFKCAPFERVDGPERAVEKSADGLETLSRLRERFPEIGMRVDFHERYRPSDFFELIPELERLRLDWLEEPFEMGPAYSELKSRTRLRVAAGELFWGQGRFGQIADNEWADVIMPDVKHVGGFGPLLAALEMARGRIEVSPHNPSGPISTAASLHAAALFPDTVRSIEFAFDSAGTRRRTGERVENGRLYLSDEPGWGIDPEPSGG
jgi:galactonate dehydratase